MDPEKLWLFQRSSELEEKLKNSEKKISDEEFRFQIVDILEKSVQKEKSILEIKLHESKLLNDSLSKEIQTLSYELTLKTSSISSLTFQLQKLSQDYSIEKQNLSNENIFLKEIIETHKIKEAKLKTQIQNLQEKVSKIVADSQRIERKTIYSQEYFEKEILQKNEEILKLSQELLEKNEKIQELEEITLVKDSEKQEFFDQICNLSNYQIEQVKKVINGEDLLVESNKKLRAFVEEYEKKKPIMLQQKIDFEDLIVFNENLKFELAEAKQELNQALNESKTTQADKESIKALKEQNEYLSTQLTFILNNSEIGQSLSISNIKQLISERIDFGVAFMEQEKIINILKEENEMLRARPVIIEEVAAEDKNLMSLEVIYQQNTQKLLELKKDLQQLTFHNQELQERLKFLNISESKLKSTIAFLTQEKDQLRLELLQKIPMSIHLFNPTNTFRDLQQSSDLYLSGYRSEIDRLKSQNSLLFSSLQADKAVLFKTQEDHKQKLSALISEKSTLYIEYKKLKIKTIELENQLKASTEAFSQDLAKKEQEKQRLDTKEFAAINELHHCRQVLLEQDHKISELSTETQCLREENKILHEKISNVAKKQQNPELKAKIEDLGQENYILRSNSELLEERARNLIRKNLQLEEEVGKLSKELNVRALENVPVIEKVSGGEERVAEQFESRIAELVDDSQRKDKQIVRLSGLLASQERFPEALGKIVALIHKISKAS